jgi:hypothetical protein
LPANPVLTHFAATLVYAGVEVGYDVNIRHVILRPYLAVGVGGIWATTTNVDDKGPAGWLGMQATYDIPRWPLFVCVDFRAMGVFTISVAESSVGAFGGLGVKFGS